MNQCKPLNVKKQNKSTFQKAINYYRTGRDGGCLICQKGSKLDILFYRFTRLGSA